MKHELSTEEYESLRIVAEKNGLTLQQAFELQLARSFREKMPESFMTVREKVDPQVLEVLEKGDPVRADLRER